MRHELKIKLSPEDQACIKQYLSYAEGDNDEVLFDKEFKFDDGNRLALRVVNSRGSTPWTEGILFSPEGAEIGLTDCDEDIYGEYVFFVGDEEYNAFVEGE